MSDRAAVFVDAQFLRIEGAKALGFDVRSSRLHAPKLVQSLRELAEELTGHRFLRLYWYDAEYPPNHPSADSQREYFRAISLTPGLTLRLGKIKPITPPWLHRVRRELERRGAADLLDRAGPIHVQKGVDTLLVLDLVRLAQRRVIHAALLVAGDRDLLDGVRAAQEDGCTVALAYPYRAGVDPDLRRTVDQTHEIKEGVLQEILYRAAPTPLPPSGAK